MEVTIRFFTVLRELTGKKEQKLQFREMEVVSVGTVLKTLVQQYGKAFSEYVYDNRTGLPKRFLQFLVNGSSVTGIEAVIKDGDILAIVPPVGGG